MCDLHPLYYTTGFAEKYAEKAGIELLRVQHHHAHVASVMAEHDIKGPAIGVSFDGTGYGTDGEAAEWYRRALENGKTEAAADLERLSRP